MAAKDRPPSQHLSFLAEAKERARTSGLFPLVRAAEGRAAHLPRVGQSKRPDQDVLRLAQVPSLAFASRTLEDVQVRAGRAKVTGYWLGLTGPMGPLPTHLTEYAAYERRYAKTRPFGDFLDLLAGRMLQLYYRSWAESQPAALADRPDDDLFAFYLAALTGATEGVAAGASFPARARVHYAGLYTGRRSATAIEDALTDLLGMRVRILEYQPRWRSIEEQDRNRLGERFVTLGEDLAIGRQVRVASDAFRVIVETGDLPDFESLLPGGARFAIAAEAIEAFAPSHLEWDLVPQIEESLIRPAQLDGQARLGWTSWLKPTRRGGIRRDTHLTRTGRRLAKERVVQ